MAILWIPASAGMTAAENPVSFTPASQKEIPPIECETCFPRFQINSMWAPFDFDDFTVDTACFNLAWNPGRRITGDRKKRAS
jgi:hypothetical protein